MRSRTYQRCAECHRPVLLAEERYDGRSPHGYRYTRHAACQATVEEQIARSREAAEARQRETVREFARTHGLPDPYAEAQA